MTEFDIIRRYFTRPTADPDVLIGVGDDAALLRADGPIAVAVDTIVAGVHFPEQIEPEAVGFRALAVNLSDVAAMGAQPRWCTLALTLPAADNLWLERFARGLLDLAARYGVSLVGGDMTRGPLTVTVQLIGVVAADKALTRRGGRGGDDIYVTGSIGDSAGGLAILEQRESGSGASARGVERRTFPTAPPGSGLRSDASDAAKAALVERFLRPTPRVEAGLALAGIASSAIDVSDGLVADLGHVCAASGCGAVVDVERLPLSAELLEAFPRPEAEAYALSGGDDYELCFTAPAAVAEEVEAAMEASGTRAIRIGRLTDSTEVLWRREGRVFTPAGRGYAHF